MPLRKQVPLGWPARFNNHTVPATLENNWLGPPSSADSGPACFAQADNCRNSRARADLDQGPRRCGE